MIPKEDSWNTLPEMWSEGKTIVNVVGAPQDPARRIFEIISKKQEMSQAELWWWNEDSPDQHSEMSTAKGNWEKYEVGKGFHKMELRQDTSVCHILVLYYRDGHDPVRLLSAAFKKSVLPFTPFYTLLPLAEYVLDRSSSRKVLCSENTPLLEVTTYRDTHAAPLTIDHLKRISMRAFRLKYEPRIQVDALRYSLASRHGYATVTGRTAKKTSG